MLNLALYSKSYEPAKLPYFQQLLDQVAYYQMRLVIYRDLAQHLKAHGLKLDGTEVYRSHTQLSGIDIMLSVGGDGTLLDTVTHVREKQIPILGINIGRLGFLATTAKDRIPAAFDALVQNAYQVENRALLQLESDRDIFHGLNFGLNEFTILKRDTSSMIVVNTFIDGEYLNSYWSDGLIVSTPTGSTGYSLSVGGPVVIPDSNNFIIAPVSPHNLNVRPLVVSDKSIISFEIEGRGKNFLVSLDSRSKKVDASVQLAVRKCDFMVKLVKLRGDNFLNTLRLKLNWGLDVRN